MPELAQGRHGPQNATAHLVCIVWGEQPIFELLRPVGHFDGDKSTGWPSLGVGAEKDDSFSNKMLAMAYMPVPSPKTRYDLPLPR